MYHPHMRNLAALAALLITAACAGAIDEPDSEHIPPSPDPNCYPDDTMTIWCEANRQMTRGYMCVKNAPISWDTGCTIFTALGVDERHDGWCCGLAQP